MTIITRATATRNMGGERGMLQATSTVSPRGCSRFPRRLPTTRVNVGATFARRSRSGCDVGKTCCAKGMTANLDMIVAV